MGQEINTSIQVHANKLIIILVKNDRFLIIIQFLFTMHLYEHLVLTLELASFFQQETRVTI